MTGFDNRRKKNQNVLILTILLAIGIHFLAILWLKDMKIDFVAMGKALIEHQHTDRASNKESKAKEGEIVKRNQQLAEAFKEITQQRPKKEEEDTQILPQVDTEFLGMQIEELSHSQAEETALALPPADGEEMIAHWDSLDSSTSLVEPKKEEPSLFEVLSPSLVTMEIISPKEDEVADELMKATEQLQGVVTIDSIEELSNQPGIKVGALETSTLIGMGADWQPGFLDVGNEDRSHLAPPIVNHTDSGEYKTQAATFLAKKTQLELDSSPSATVKDRKELFVFKQKEARSSGNPIDTTVLASSDHFNLNVAYTRRPRGNGYLFRLELVPKPNVVFKPISQNFYFLIDRSNSIGQTRYEASKTAVMKALRLLRKGDTFNIIVFDDKATKLSETNLQWNLINFLKAQDFLRSQKTGGLFATTDLYSSLDSIVPQEVAENEINTAILLSDGDTYLAPDQQRHTIGQWTERNKGKVSLYSVALSSGDNLALLDLLCSFNKGSLCYGPHESDLEGMLVRLVQALQNPIGKSITASKIVKDPNLKVAILPSSHRMANLYQDTPYVIYGKTNQLKDFHIFFQGRYFDKWLDIKQAVSFNHAEEISPEDLEKVWAIQLAYDSYERFLSDNNLEHLSRARRLVAPYRLSLPFQ